MSMSLTRISSLVIGLAVLQGCGAAEEQPNEAPEPDGAEIAQTPTLTDQLLGSWTGENETRGRMSFSFADDGTVQWVIYPPSGPDTVYATYMAEEVNGRLNLDLSGFDEGPLAGLEMYGLVVFEGTDSFSVDFEPGPAGDPSPRPSDLSSTDVLTLGRVGANQVRPEREKPSGA